MSSVGLVLGGGGITGAACQTATLLALHMATGWDPASAQVVVGTSGGAVIAAMVRGHGISIDALVGDAHGPHELTSQLKAQLFTRARPGGIVSWARHGLLRGLTRPGLSFVLGSPAPFSVSGIAEWVDTRLGDFDGGWPDRPTVIVAFDLENGRRVAFGTDEAPDVTLPDAVAASCAVPLIYQPHVIDGRHYLDGGVVSGTHADLVLGSTEPLDLVLVLAPMALSSRRPGARFYEPFLDRAGSKALDAEIEHIAAAWPESEILIMTPPEETLDELRPNPMAVEATVPSFFRTLRSLRHDLAQPEVWDVLSRHLLQPNAVGR